MVDESRRDEVAATMREINKAWLDGRIEDIAPSVHSEIVMVFPGFTGRIEGRDDFLESFRDFSQNATIHEFDERDHQIDIMGSTAACSFNY